MDEKRLEELSAGFVLGDLTKGEKKEFSKLRRSASPKAREKSAEVINAGAVFSMAVPRQAPSPALLLKLMASVAKGAKAEPSHLPTEGFRFVHAPVDSDWLQLPTPGAYIKLLSMDDEKNYAVVLGKLDPGASYPPHVHTGPEETFVLSGDLFIGNVKLSPGDFHSAAAGSRHGFNHSDSGCITLGIVAKRDFHILFAGG